MELDISTGKLDYQSKGLFLTLHKKKISRMNDKKAERSLSNWNSCYFANFPHLSQFSESELQRQRELLIPSEDCKSIAIIFCWNSTSSFPRGPQSFIWEKAISKLFNEYRVRIYIDTQYGTHAIIALLLELNLQIHLGSIAIQWGCLGTGNKWDPGILGLAHSVSTSFMDPTDVNWKRHTWSLAETLGVGIAFLTCRVRNLAQLKLLQLCPPPSQDSK